MKKVQGKHKIQESRQFHKEEKWQAEVTPTIWRGKQSSEETTWTKAQGPLLVSNTGRSTPKANVKLMRILLKDLYALVGQSKY